MPNNLAEVVVTASPNNVLPSMTYTSYKFNDGAYPVLQNLLHMGDVQMSNIQDGVNPAEPLRTWSLTVRLTSSELTTLKNFYKAQFGTLGAWYFYDPYQQESGTAVGSNYDATGVSEIGRFTCRFTNPQLMDTFTLGRSNVSFSLMEVN